MHIAPDRSSMSLLEKRDKETIESVLKGRGIWLHKYTFTAKKNDSQFIYQHF